MAVGDYTDWASVKAHVGLAASDTSKDHLIEALITAFSRAIDNFCHRTFYAATETRVYDFETAERLWLDKDLISVTTLTNGDGDTLVDGTDFYKMPYSGPPYRWLQIKADSGAQFQWSGTPQRAITIAGSWGYASTTPAPVARACVLWVADALGRQGFEAVTDAQIGDERIKFVAAAPSEPPALAAALLMPFIRRDYA